MRVNIRHFETIFWSPCLIARVASVKMIVAEQMSLVVGGTFSKRSLWPLCMLRFWPTHAWQPLSGDCVFRPSFITSRLYLLFILFYLFLSLGLTQWFRFYSDNFSISLAIGAKQVFHWWTILISGKSNHEDSRVKVDVSRLLAVQLLGFQLWGGAEASCISITCALTAGPLGAMLHSGPEPLTALNGEGKQGQASTDWVATLGCLVDYMY